MQTLDSLFAKADNPLESSRSTQVVHGWCLQVILIFVSDVKRRIYDGRCLQVSRLIKCLATKQHYIVFTLTKAYCSCHMFGLEGRREMSRNFHIISICIQR